MKFVWFWMGMDRKLKSFYKEAAYHIRATSTINHQAVWVSFDQTSCVEQVFPLIFKFLSLCLTHSLLMCPNPLHFQHWIELDFSFTVFEASFFLPMELSASTLLAATNFSYGDIESFLFTKLSLFQVLEFEKVLVRDVYLFECSFSSFNWSSILRA